MTEWKLVPVEITEEMWSAFFKARDEIFPAQRDAKRAKGRGWTGLPAVVWDELLAASPPPPVQQGEAVAWQRLHPTDGWVFVSLEDRVFYAERGQQLRPLYLAPPSREEGLREALRNLHEPAIITAASNARLGITAHTVRSIVRDYLNAHPALRSEAAE